MLWRNRNRYILAAGVCTVTLLSAGCGGAVSERQDMKTAQADDRAVSADDGESADSETIAEILRDIYDEAASENTLGSLVTMRRMAARLGEYGYTAVDMENQIDMTRAEQTLAFCKAVEDKEKDEMTIIVLAGPGFHKYDLKTCDGHVNVLREYYQYDQNGELQKENEAGYPADLWQYTEEGYLFFQGSYFSDEDFVLTASDAAEQTALRVLPLDETCRELNRKYIRPVGYTRNNMFLTDWSEEDFGSLDFYDVFDRFYPILYGQPMPYTANDAAETELVYKIPENIFENVVTAHFRADKETLRSKTIYLSENAAYQYRPRGFYESEYLDIPYPEVVSCLENEDGTITLIVNAVYPKENTSKSFSHKTVIRPLDESGFQYVSNKIISPGGVYDAWWHSDRMEEERDLITETEKEEIKNTVLTAAEQVREVYKDIELTGELPYGSNIKEFTAEQCREVVSLLGRAGYVSVADDINMENYEKIEAFYAAYRERRDAMVTLYNVDHDGLVGAITFIYRDGRLQIYYAGIGWQEGSYS